jgi:hypothetical protein
MRPLILKNMTPWKAEEGLKKGVSLFVSGRRNVIGKNMGDPDLGGGDALWSAISVRVITER